MVLTPENNVKTAIESLIDASVVLVMHHIDSDFVIVPLHDLPVSPLTKTHFTATFQCVLFILLLWFFIPNFIFEKVIKTIVFFFLFLAFCAIRYRSFDF